jgi:hypothetical protein
MVGWAYGIPVYGPVCYVNRADNVPVPAFFNSIVFDGTGFFIPVSHSTAEIATSISYCISPGAGSVVTNDMEATGSIDTSMADVNTNRDIYDITEEHLFGGMDQVLGPETRPTFPQQGPQVQSRDSMYGDVWFPSGTATQICNTYFVLGDNGQNLFLASPLGCNGHTLP